MLDQKKPQMGVGSWPMNSLVSIMRESIAIDDLGNSESAKTMVPL